MSVNYEQLYKGLKGSYIRNFTISHMAYYQLGGSIDLYAIPETKEDVQSLIKRCCDENIPYFVFGKGSNLLISDSGYRGVFISLEKSCNELQLTNGESKVGAGILLWDLVKETIGVGLGDMSSMSWIPGTVGGALFMNAGAFGTEIEEFVDFVEVIDNRGERYKLGKKECMFTYRNSGLQNGFTVLGAGMKFTEKDRNQMRKNSLEIINKRKSKQPLDYPSCGSVFKRPLGFYAGTLIEECGLKGYRKGGAEVSEKHANFILNKKAKSSDIYQVIQHIQETVYKKKGIQLEREVRLVGFEHERI